MGYYMDLVEDDFFIPEENREAALAALKSVPEKEVSWLRGSYLNAKTLAECVKCWRWDFHFLSNPESKDIEFLGEKLGSDDLFFQTLAPFVKAGSYVEMRGEDGSHWRWVFDGKSVKEVNPTIIWSEANKFRPEEFKQENPHDQLAAILGAIEGDMLNLLADVGDPKAQAKRTMEMVERCKKLLPFLHGVEWF